MELRDDMNFSRCSRANRHRDLQQDVVLVFSGFRSAHTPTVLEMMLELSIPMEAQHDGQGSATVYPIPNRSLIKCRFILHHQFEAGTAT